MTGFDAVWHRIVALQGQTFHQKTGKPFRYRVPGNSVVPSTTNRQLPRSHFARAYERAPIAGPGQLQDLQGPSYLYAILTDPRVLADGPRGASSRPDGNPESSDAATDGRPPYAALTKAAARCRGRPARRAPENLIEAPAASMLGRSTLAGRC